jgi:hypothetical protein
LQVWAQGTDKDKNEIKYKKKKQHKKNTDNRKDE